MYLYDYKLFSFCQINDVLFCSVPVKKKKKRVVCRQKANAVKPEGSIINAFTFQIFQDFHVVLLKIFGSEF